MRKIRIIYLISMFLIGMIVTALYGNSPQADSVVYQSQPDDIIQMVFAPNASHPHLVTHDGKLLAPSDQGWQPMLSGEVVNDIYIEFNGVIWAGTDQGLKQYQHGVWQTIPDVPPTEDVEAMHGFLFAMGQSGVTRGTKDWRALRILYPEAPATGFEMLGNHSHVLLNNGLAVTNDMGLSWTTIDVPGTISRIAADSDGNLLAVLEDGVYRWYYREQTWAKVAPLVPIKVIQNFQNNVYVLSEGMLLQLSGGSWKTIELPTNVYLFAMQVKQLNTLWVADALNDMLWFTGDLENWEAVPVVFKGDE